MSATETWSVEFERTARHALPTAGLSLAVRETDRQALVGCMDGVYRVDAESGEAERLYAHQSYASGMAFDADRRTCISSGYDGRLIWYDLDAGRVIRELQAHAFWSWGLALSTATGRIASATGQYLAGGYRYEPAAEREPSVKVFDVESGELIHALSHLPPVQSIAFSPDGTRLAAANLMGDIRVWDAETGTLTASWNTPAFTSWGIIKSHCYIGGIYALHFTPDGRHLLAAGMGPMRDPMAGNGRQLWQRFDVDSEPVAKVDETHAKESGEGLMETLAVHPSGGYFVMAGRLRGGDWNAGIFSLATGERIGQLKTGSRVTAAHFTADGRELWLAGTQGQPEPKEGKQPPFGHLEIYQIRSG